MLVGGNPVSNDREVPDRDHELPGRGHETGASDRDVAELVGVHRSGDARRVGLAVTGELDSYTAPAFLDPLDAALADRPVVVVLDLTAVTFFASAALRGLLDAQLRAAVAGVRLAVVASQVVFRVLELTGTLALLDVHPTVRSAVAGGCDSSARRRGR